jgi:hypothetical protein
MPLSKVADTKEAVKPKLLKLKLSKTKMKAYIILTSLCFQKFFDRNRKEMIRKERG